ncbi:MAG TPA: hypothetical protein VHB79_25500 [Polyangiaceae bacterium]|nr:hypothetical protein [Polyangiaceae bacterium]
MLSAGTKRVAITLGLCLSLTLGCSSRTLTPHDVKSEVDPQTTYAGVLAVAAEEEYIVMNKDDAAKAVRLKSKASSNSYIDVQVVGAEVKLTPGGGMVDGNKIHRKLNNELEDLQGDLKDRFRDDKEAAAKAVASAAPAAVPAAAPAGAAPVAAGSGPAAAWSEPAYDPSVWGNGNFTCLPVRVPAEHQSALTLQLSNGERADLQLSLAYDAGLCRSPVQCKQPGGCPALGIGDAERVSRIAGRLSRGEIGSSATLLDGGKPVATIDLAHHGSIVQALSEIKH